MKAVLLAAIKDKVVSEFLKLGLQDKFKEDIEAWFIYLDQQRFGKKLEKQMIDEIDRYLATKKSIDEIISETFKKPDWEKLFIEDMPKNYIFKSVLGYN